MPEGSGAVRIVVQRSTSDFELIALVTTRIAQAATSRTLEDWGVGLRSENVLTSFNLLEGRLRGAGAQLARRAHAPGGSPH